MSFNRKTPPADGQLGQEGEEGEKRQPEERNRYTMWLHKYVSYIENAELNLSKSIPNCGVKLQRVSQSAKDILC